MLLVERFRVRDAVQNQRLTVRAAARHPRQDAMDGVDCTPNLLAGRARPPAALATSAAGASSRWRCWCSRSPSDRRRPARGENSEARRRHRRRSFTARRPRIFPKPAFSPACPTSPWPASAGREGDADVGREIRPYTAECVRTLRPLPHARRVSSRSGVTVSFFTTTPRPRSATTRSSRSATAHSTTAASTALAAPGRPRRSKTAPPPSSAPAASRRRRSSARRCGDYDATSVALPAQTCT